MANQKVSELTEVSTLNANAEFHVNNNGVSERLKVVDIPIVNKIRRVDFKVTPGSIPTTNVTIAEETAGAFNLGETLVTGTNVTEGNKVGNWSLEDSGKGLVFEPTKTVIAVLSSVVYIQGVGATRWVAVNARLEAVGDIKLNLWTGASSTSIDWRVDPAAGKVIFVSLTYLTSD